MEVARLVGKTERTIRQWIADGRLPAEPAGRRATGPGVGPCPRLIDTDAFTRMPGLCIDPRELAELEARPALTGWVQARTCWPGWRATSAGQAHCTRK